MEVTMKHLCLLGFFAVASVIGLESANGVGECGTAPVDRLALRMVPCAEASQDAQAEVSDGCCSEVRKLGSNPSCLCAVMLSNTAKSSGVKPEVAITIPKRCNLADRPVIPCLEEHSVEGK
ncbi:Type 5 nonspecific lipid transfer protein LTP502 [Cocos nucifera]|uniref:Type 5 nonspecific lipid transfer protein LTP502 n=1 Tax=Cocos nucifera TaxID=13894 RepID=A0A8K0I8B0_COCNU|nr:Type 5 nonspecific lipid transfer protein LTP502 [Cocos nucifera]